MKQHHCKSIKNHNHQCFTYNHVIVPCQPIIRCNGICFQRDFYQYPSYVRYPTWSARPLACNVLLNYPFHKPSYFEKINTNQKSVDPSSYRVTVRRITPSHVADTSTEAYRVQRNKDSDKIYLQPFNQIIAFPDPKFRTNPTTHVYERDNYPSNNQYIPSVPSKKIMPKNNGLHVSSTSFITTSDDQKSFVSDHLLEKCSEYHMIDSRTLDISTVKIINKNIDNISNGSPLSKQTESVQNSVNEERSSIKLQPAIDKGEQHENQSIQEEFSPSELSHHDIPDELNIISSLVDILHRPTLPSSIPPNIDIIKSSEILIKPLQSVKSITSLKNVKQKSSTVISKSSLPLRNARSTLDFGFLIDETSTENF